MSAFWRIADQADLTWRHWDGEYVFHHALSNDTLRLSDAAGMILLQLMDAGETAQSALAERFELESADLDAPLADLAKLGLLVQR